MKRILIPTDFSDNAYSALDFALELALEFGAELFILNACNIPYSSADMFASLNDIIKKDSTEGLEKTSKYIRTSEKYKDIPFQTKSIFGDTIASLNDYAKEVQPDLIIMGTRGASGIEEVLLGSYTASAIQSVKFPIYVIPQGVDFKKPSKIVFATDLMSRTQEKPLRKLIDFVNWFGADITMIHSMKSDEVMTPEKESVKNELIGLFPENKVTFETITGRNNEEGLKNYLENNNPDLFVMIARKYGFIQRIFNSSLTKKISYSTQIPLLALHE
jgi:nucleotide-binding universal stress UspA family protein